jgi:retron-type reverse transcriptase
VRLFAPAGKGIPQGAVVSPFLCNVYLTALDDDLAKSKIRFVRFADNVFAMARSRDEAHALRKHLAARVRRLDLDLNPEKTRIVRCGPGVTFLGRSLPAGGTVHRGGIPAPMGLGRYDFPALFQRLIRLARSAA